jgi:hypothetical protein
VRDDTSRSSWTRSPADYHAQVAGRRLDVVLDNLDEIAAEQGSASAEVVLQNYLSDARARKLRREYMRDQLAAAFEPSEE